MTRTVVARSVRTVALALVVAAALAGAHAAPALAWDGGGYGGYGWHRHWVGWHRGWRHWDWHDRWAHPWAWGYDPGFYAPPPVYPAPVYAPPVYAYPPSLNITVPLSIP
jgi:hypothetical protein